MATSLALRAPFPWFGGKSRIAHLVWERFGDIPNYVEPFFGSGAVLLRRPTDPGIETVNDICCYVSNFWRSLQHEPDAVAHWADYPVNEADLHARHLWLVNQERFIDRMKSDPDFYDVKIAGWWVWGIACWIGSGWCSRPEWSGRINGARAGRGVSKNSLARPELGTGNGLHKKRPHLANDGRGLHKKRPHLGDEGRGINRLALSLPDISGSRGAAGRSVHGSGLKDRSASIIAWMHDLSARLRNVRVCCGDWKRVIGPASTVCIGQTGIFLDPPYSERVTPRKLVYANDSLKLANDVWEWAIINGHNPQLRVALCGYEGEHEFPPDWTMVSWRANGGHANNGRGRGKELAGKERVWFSPHCLKPEQELFAK